MSNSVNINAWTKGGCAAWPSATATVDIFQLTALFYSLLYRS
jgi:hypothetical protein